GKYLRRRAPVEAAARHLPVAARMAAGACASLRRPPGFGRNPRHHGTDVLTEEKRNGRTNANHQEALTAAEPGVFQNSLPHTALAPLSLLCAHRTGCAVVSLARRGTQPECL